MPDEAYLELKNLILDLRDTIQLIMPKKASVSYICDTTGKSRQTITSFLHNNYEPDVDYWKENGKIMVSKETTIKLLRRYNAR